jgi:hypothetical protein
MAYRRARLALFFQRIALGALFGAISACGGGSLESESVAVATTTRGAMNATKLSLDAPTSAETEVIIFKFNVPGGQADQDGGLFLVNKAFQALDAAGVPSTLLECGEYSPEKIPLGSYAGYTPMAITFRVNNSDIPKALTAGGKVRGLDNMYIVHPEQCGDLAYHTSATARVFWYASAKYPQFFPGIAFRRPPQQGYEYAYFEDTGNYIGVKNGRVYVHNGRDWNYLDVGAVTDYIPAAPSPDASAGL